MTQRKTSSFVSRLCCAPSLRDGSGTRVSRDLRLELRVVLAQFLLVAVLALVGSLFSVRIAGALAWGAAIIAVSNGWLAFTVLRVPVGAEPKKILATFYWGLLGKWMIAAAFFAISFKKCLWLREGVYLGLMFAGMMAALSAHWILPAWRRQK